MRWKGKYPLKTFKVKSRSSFNPDTGEWYYWTIEMWDKEMFCDCPAIKECHHIKMKREELIKEFGSLEKAIEHFRKNKQ